MTKKDLLDTIFNSEETKPITMLKAFHKFVGVMVDYVEEHAVKGDKGDKGEKGSKGDKGEKGLSMYSSTSDYREQQAIISHKTIRPLGSVVSVGDYILSKNGLLFRVSSLHNIEGSLHYSSDFITKLKGEQGKQGDKGDKGEQGEQGIGGVGYYGKKLPLDEHNVLDMNDLISFINENGNEFKFYTQYNVGDGLHFGVRPTGETNYITPKVSSGSIKIDVDLGYLVINDGSDVYYLDLQQKQAVEFTYPDDFEIYSVQKPSVNGGAGGGWELLKVYNSVIEGYLYEEDVLNYLTNYKLFCFVYYSSETPYSLIFDIDALSYSNYFCVGNACISILDGVIEIDAPGVLKIYGVSK